MKLFKTLYSMIVVVSASTYSNLGFMRKVSNRLPDQGSGEFFGRSITGVPYRRIILDGNMLNIRIKKSDLVKSRRLRNTLTNGDAEHFDEPLLYRTNPTYAMKPDVIDRIKALQEIRPN